MTDQEILNTFTRYSLIFCWTIRSFFRCERDGKTFPTGDSFNYINFIVAVEIEFGVKFKVADIESFENIGAIITETKAILG